MGKSLNELDKSFRPLAESLINRANAAGLQVVVISTGRTKEEQEENIKKGVSWTQHSKHLIGKAIDLCPKELLKYKDWKPESPMWTKLAEIGRELNLVCGYYWNKKDCPHFEMKESK